ncbi:MAG: cell division protein ZapB, partial [Leptospirales bacterium]
MITMEQLEQLEGRIVKALDLISDLRVENSHLESEVERLKANADQLKLTAEEKIAEA